MAYNSKWEPSAYYNTCQPTPEMLNKLKKSPVWHECSLLIQAKSGTTYSKLKNPETPNIRNMPHMAEAKSLLDKAIAEKRETYIIGDYDADGLTATAILVNLLGIFGIEPTTIIPKRFTDGYGINLSHITNIRNSLIITVDNGIKANEALNTAKKADNDILILDHHLTTDELPQADVIIDPHLEDSYEFQEYCGAGIAYRFAEYLLSDTPLLKTHQHKMLTMCVLAAIGTMADCVPLVGDNRRIVCQGLRILNECDKNGRRYRDFLPAGLRMLVQTASEPYTTDSLSFTIAPILNAPGRLYNGGSTSSLKCLLCDDALEATGFVAKMQNINDDRKRKVTQWTKAATEQAERQSQNPILTLYCKDMPQGIIGIVAGKLAEETGKPCIVFTDAADKEGTRIIKGSGRSAGSFDMAQMLESIKHIALSAGGHIGAAGISVAPERLAELCAAILAYGREHISPAENQSGQTYDMVITGRDIPDILDAQSHYEPFGEGVSKPTVVIWNCDMTQSPKFMGKSGEHIKLICNGYEAVGFGLAEKFRALKNPNTVSIIGTLGTNTFNGVTKPQFQISDISTI